MLSELDQDYEGERKWESHVLAVFQQESWDILDTSHKTQAWWVGHELINSGSKDFPCHNVKSASTSCRTCLATRALAFAKPHRCDGAIPQTSAFLWGFPPSARSPLMLVSLGMIDLGVLGPIQSMPGLGDIWNKLESVCCFQLKVL